MSNDNKFLVVIGASANGLNPLTKLVSQLDATANAAYCIALHLTATETPDFLANYLQQHTSLPCVMAAEGMPLQPDNIYLAVPNKHLVVKQDKLVLGHGPQENRWRPSIDVLFRSAAVAYNGHTIGVLLTGLMDDGTAGMKAIKECGGTCIVQDPKEADYPAMPRSVLENVPVEFTLPVAEIGNKIKDIIEYKEIKQVAIPNNLVAEANIAAEVGISIDRVEAIGDLCVYGCPDCGGNLWRIKDDGISRYRCHIGHAYSEIDLMRKQAEASEASIWTAIRLMEERRKLYLQMIETCKSQNLETPAGQFLTKVNELKKHIDNLKQIIASTQNLQLS